MGKEEDDSFFPSSLALALALPSTQETGDWGRVKDRLNKNRGAVVNRALKKRGYLHCLRSVTLLPFSKYTKKGVSDYILCIARV